MKRLVIEEEKIIHNLEVNGDMMIPNRFGCDMQRKRLECAIAMKAHKAGMV